MAARPLRQVPCNAGNHRPRCLPSPARPVPPYLYYPYIVHTPVSFEPFRRGKRSPLFLLLLLDFLLLLVFSSFRLVFIFSSSLFTCFISSLLCFSSSCSCVSRLCSLSLPAAWFSYHINNHLPPTNLPPYSVPRSGLCLYHRSSTRARPLFLSTHLDIYIYNTSIYLGLWTRLSSLSPEQSCLRSAVRAELS